MKRTAIIAVPGSGRGGRSSPDPVITSGCPSRTLWEEPQGPLLRGLHAEVSDVPLQFDSVTRSLRVRPDADNPGLVLRPDMFVDVELPVTYPPTTTVPADALVDSGLNKTVFVDKGNGIFEPRKMETGWRHGDQVEIVKGLMPGELIVISGTFLIDSESRMKAAAAGSWQQASCSRQGAAIVRRGEATSSARRAPLPVSNWSRA